MRILIKLYRLLNILSIDVAAGAIIIALFFSQIFEVSILASGLATLFLTVWIIYTADHLLDAYAVKEPASSSRHRFHQRNFRTLFVIAALAVIVVIILLFFVRARVIVGGVLIGALIVIYLFIHRKIPFMKEFFVAVLYTCGVILPSIAIKSTSVNFSQALFIAEIFNIAFLNLLIFSLLDYRHDKNDNLKSIVVVLGEPVGKRIISATFFIQFTLLFFHVKEFYSSHIIVILAMSLTLFVLFLFRKSFVRGNAYRLIGDLVFIYPIVLLI